MDFPESLELYVVGVDELHRGNDVLADNDGLVATIDRDALDLACNADCGSLAIQDASAPFHQLFIVIFPERDRCVLVILDDPIEVPLELLDWSSLGTLTSHASTSSS